MKGIITCCCLSLSKIFVTLNPFVFSNEATYRITRHLAFWAVFYFYTIINYLPGASLRSFFDPSFYHIAFNDILHFFPVFIFSVYFSLYFIMPRYLARKNLSFIIASVCSLIIITVTACYLISDALSKMDNIRWKPQDVITLASRKSIGEQIIVTGSAIILKVVKDFLLKQRENELLEVENVRNKLRLLKMQIHPRILFDCLQDIYKDLDAGTLHAPHLILQLSELLGYFLYESDKKLVSLSVELRMMQNYVQIKKIGYNKSADIFFHIDGSTNAKYVTPGIFLPLMETFFPRREYFERPLKIDLSLKVGLSKLLFYIKNNLPGGHILQGGITGQNIEIIDKRIKLFHPDSAKLEVHSDENSLSVVLQLEIKNVINPQMQIDENLMYEFT